MARDFSRSVVGPQCLSASIALLPRGVRQVANLSPDRAVSMLSAVPRAHTSVWRCQKTMAQNEVALGPRANMMTLQSCGPAASVLGCGPFCPHPHFVFHAGYWNGMGLRKRHTCQSRGPKSGGRPCEASPAWELTADPPEGAPKPTPFLAHPLPKWCPPLVIVLWSQSAAPVQLQARQLKHSAASSRS